MVLIRPAKVINLIVSMPPFDEKSINVNTSKLWIHCPRLTEKRGFQQNVGLSLLVHEIELEAYTNLVSLKLTYACWWPKD